LTLVSNSYTFADMKSTALAIQERVKRLPRGEPFTTHLFIELGPRTAVHQALSRLVRAGSISRVAKGVYVKPRISAYVGAVTPEPLKVAQAIAAANGEKVQVHGAEAARRLELSTQMPTRPVFYTSGASRRVNVRGTPIQLRHVASRKLALAGRPAGLALSAMWYLGRNQTTPVVVEKIKSRLPTEEFEALRSATAYMPAWMAEAIRRVESPSPRA
jgi:predicted transcriptional regulator of viral defense system